MLSKMLENSKQFTALTTINKEVTLRLADAFESRPDSIYKSHIELPSYLRIGTKEQWFDFLNLEPVRQYITAQMGFLSTIAVRQNFQKLQEQAMQGNIQALKELNDISPFFNQQEQNKVIILHQIARPKVAPTDSSSLEPQKD